MIHDEPERVEEPPTKATETNPPPDNIMSSYCSTSFIIKSCIVSLIILIILELVTDNGSLENHDHPLSNAISSATSPSSQQHERKTSSSNNKKGKSHQKGDDDSSSSSSDVDDHNNNHNRHVLSEEERIRSALKFLPGERVDKLDPKLGLVGRNWPDQEPKRIVDQRTGGYQKKDFDVMVVSNKVQEEDMKNLLKMKRVLTRKSVFSKLASYQEKHPHEDLGDFGLGAAKKTAAIAKVAEASGGGTANEDQQKNQHHQENDPHHPLRGVNQHVEQDADNKARAKAFQEKYQRDKIEAIKRKEHARDVRLMKLEHRLDDHEDAEQHEQHHHHDKKVTKDDAENNESEETTRKVVKMTSKKIRLTPPPLQRNTKPTKENEQDGFDDPKAHKILPKPNLNTNNDHHEENSSTKSKEKKKNKKKKQKKVDHQNHHEHEADFDIQSQKLKDRLLEHDDEDKNPFHHSHHHKNNRKKNGGKAHVERKEQHEDTDTNEE